MPRHPGRPAGRHPVLEPLAWRAENLRLKAGCYRRGPLLQCQPEADKTAGEAAHDLRSDAQVQQSTSKSARRTTLATTRICLRRKKPGTEPLNAPAARM